MTLEERGRKIMNESDPFLREVWAMGWTECFMDARTRDVVLVDHESRIEKCLKYDEYRDVVMKCTIIYAIKHDGSPYNWISDKDGSGDRFRSLITKP